MTWHTTHEYWQAAIKVGGKNKYLGHFKEEEDGLKAVNKAYAKYFPDNPEFQQLTQRNVLIKENGLICKKWK